MADCNETLNELERFLDEELTHQDRENIRAHLDGCLDCLQAFDFHAELRMVIAIKCRDEPLPPSLLQRLESCLQVDLDGDGQIG